MPLSLLRNRSMSVAVDWYCRPAGAFSFTYSSPTTISPEGSGRRPWLCRSHWRNVSLHITDICGIVTDDAHCRYSCVCVGEEYGDVSITFSSPCPDPSQDFKTAS